MKNIKILLLLPLVVLLLTACMGKDKLVLVSTEYGDIKIKLYDDALDKYYHAIPLLPDKDKVQLKLMIANTLFCAGKHKDSNDLAQQIINSNPPIEVFYEASLLKFSIEQLLY